MPYLPNLPNLPGERWVVSQMVGEAGWTSVNTLKFKSEKTRCGPERTTTTTTTTSTMSTTSTTASTSEKNTSVTSDKNSSGPKLTTSKTASTAEKSSVTFCALILLVVFLNLSPSLWFDLFHMYVCWPESICYEYMYVFTSFQICWHAFCCCFSAKKHLCYLQICTWQPMCQISKHY